MRIKQEAFHQSDHEEPNVGGAYQDPEVPLVTERRFTRRQIGVAIGAGLGLAVAAGAGLATSLEGAHATGSVPVAVGKPSPDSHKGGLPGTVASQAPNNFQTPSASPTNTYPEFAVPPNVSASFTETEVGTSDKYNVSVVVTNRGMANPADFVLSIDEIVGPNAHTNYHSVGATVIDAAGDLRLTYDSIQLAEPVNPSDDIDTVSAVYYEGGVPPNTPDAYSISFSSGSLPASGGYVIPAGNLGVPG